MTGKPSEAEAEFRLALPISQKLANENPAVIAFSKDLASVLWGLGRSQHRTGRFAKAIEPLRRAIALGEAIHDLDVYVLYGLASSHASMASLAADPRAGLSTGVAKDESDRAMATLRWAVTAGVRNRAELNSDPTLESLRQRGDFRLLLMDLATPADPFPQDK